MKIKKDKLWCEEYRNYYGNSDHQYEAKLIDLRALEPGTKFEVAHGWWHGEKLQEDYILAHAPSKDRIVELTKEHHSLYLQ